jgi:hypothetical protein
MCAKASPRPARSVKRARLDALLACCCCFAALPALCLAGEDSLQYQPRPMQGMLTPAEIGRGISGGLTAMPSMRRMQPGGAGTSHAAQPQAAAAGMLSAAATMGASAASLKAAAALAAVSHAMYPPKHAAGALGTYSDCARPHAAVNKVQTATAAQVAQALGASAADVTFFDVNLGSQFCHAAAVYVDASASARLGLPRPSQPAVVVAFRGSSNFAAAAADLKFTTAQATVRGQAVQVHAGFWTSLSGPVPAASCHPGGHGAVPSSCAAAIEQHVASLASQHHMAGPVQVVVTGHSLGAAHAALFALRLDQAGGYDVAAYTFGQPKIGRGQQWRRAYDGPHGLSARTFRVVHGADPVPMLASRCQTREPANPDEFQQVGQLIRVLYSSASCPHHKGAGAVPGRCEPFVAPGAVTCTVEGESQWDSCSIFVGTGPKSGKNDVCFCGVMPTGLLGTKKGLWGDHEADLYATNIASCTGLKPVAPGPPSGSCGAKYTQAEYCAFKA